MTVQPNPQPTTAVNVVRQWDGGELLVPERDDVLPWELAVQHLAGASLFWQVTQRPDSHAHVRPVFAVESDGTLCSTTSAGARKAELLGRHPRCSLAASTDGMDLVYEGAPSPLTSPTTWNGSPPPTTASTAGPSPSPQPRRLRRPLRGPGSRPAAVPGVRVRTDHRVGIRNRRPLRHPLDPLGLRPRT